jgi:hypothetical protein
MESYADFLSGSLANEGMLVFDERINAGKD